MTVLLSPLSPNSAGFAGTRQADRGRGAPAARPCDQREGAGPRPPHRRNSTQQPRSVAGGVRLNNVTALLSLLTPKLACLALTLQAQGKLDEAEPLMRRDLSITEKSLGPDHPDVATGLNNLAQLLKVRGSTT